MSVQTRRFSLHGLLALLLLLAMLLTMGVAGAATNEDAATPIDVFCVTGSVIDHAEQASADWTITAVMYDSATGLLDPATAVDVDTINVDDSDDGPLGSFKFDGLMVGKWNFSIGTRVGWSPVTPASFDVSLPYGRRDCATIRFKMRQDVTVKVLKIDTNHTPLADYTIKATPGAGNFFASPVEITTGDDGMAVFTLTPGLWEFTEIAPAGSQVSPVAPATGAQSLDVVAPGPYSIRFKNRVYGGQGCIEVYKRDVPPAGSNQEPTGLPGWHVDVLRSDGSTAASGVTNALGSIVFNDLPFGPYTVREVIPTSEWEAASAAIYSVTVNSEDCITVEFSNRQVEPAFCIVGRKVDTNGLVGLPGWEITATPTASTGYKPGATTTDGLGYFRIDFPTNDYRIPDAEYNVCETAVDGWLAHTDTCQKVRLPSSPGACVNTSFDFENQQVGHAESQGSGAVPPTCDYTVKAGDQLYKIGRDHNRTPAQMLAANPSIRHPNWIRPGQKICIP